MNNPAKTMYRALLFLVFTIASIADLHGQSQTDELRTIYIQDGSVFIGKIVSANFFQVVMVATTGDTLHINKGLISNKIKRVKGPKFHFSEGLFAALELNRYSEYKEAQMDAMIGVHVNETYDVGLGFGVHHDLLDRGGLRAVNYFRVIYAHGRRYFKMKNKDKPFITMKAGYGISHNMEWRWNNNHHNGGVYLQPCIGYQFATRAKFRPYASLSQHFQHTTGQQNWIENINPVDVNYSIWHTNVVFKIGVMFM